MENAHLRLGKLRLIRQTRDTITEVTVHLERLIAEVPPERGETAFHLVSIFGGDQEIGAVVAAAQEGLRFQVEWPDRQIIGTLGEKPTVVRASLQIPGRRRPVRHAIGISATLAETALGANAEAQRTILYDGAANFVLHRLSVRFGMPTVPAWADWFRAQLDAQGIVKPLYGFGCQPISVHGTKAKLMDILSQGLKSRSIALPIA